MYGSLFYVLPILAVIAKTVFRAVLPLLIGCMIAYVVNILMCFYEKGYARICRMAAIAPLQRPLCMTLSYLSLVLVILILWWMIVPQLLSCIRIIATDFPQVLELLCEWANEHLQMDLGMGNEIRAWMNEPFCWDTLIVKIPRLAKGMKTSLEKLGSWLLIFPETALDEFRDAIKALHKAGIEVILDIVLNHSAELDLDGPLFSLRGIDNRSYYWIREDGDYHNWTGCGNTLNLSHPAVVDYASACLRAATAAARGFGPLTGCPPASFQ